MADREKVIKALEDADVTNGIIKMSNQFRDILVALLKEQEAVPPEREYSGGGITWWNVCGACRVAINPNDKYCHECGRPVKWE